MFVLLTCVIHPFIHSHHRLRPGFEVTTIHSDGHKQSGGDFEGLVRTFFRFGGVDLVKCAQDFAVPCLYMCWLCGTTFFMFNFDKSCKNKNTRCYNTCTSFGIENSLFYAST